MPQEKVRELANKTPAQLLRETEKAAGGPELHALHEKLIDIKRNEASLAKARSFPSSLTRQRVDEQKSNLASKEDRLSAMQRDLERFRERAEIEDQVRSRFHSTNAAAHSPQRTCSLGAVSRRQGPLRRGQGQTPRAQGAARRGQGGRPTSARPAGRTSRQYQEARATTQRVHGQARCRVGQARRFGNATVPPCSRHR